MNKFLEIAFLNNLEGVGKTTIFKKYWNALCSSKDIDELVEYVAKEGKHPDDICYALEEAKSIERTVNDNDIKVITIFDSNYPSKLNSMGNKKPLIIYARGNIDALSKYGVAVVGSRETSEHSLVEEKKWIKERLDEDVAIISGLAIGCDEVAHQTTLEANGTTIAVLPSGVNAIYPTKNRALAKEIIGNGGLLISEYMPNIKTPQKYMFVERNAVIAALSDEVMIVECSKKSGTMQTYNSALEYGKKIDCFEPNSKMNHFDGNELIIKELQSRKNDVFEQIGMF